MRSDSEVAHLIAALCPGDRGAVDGGMRQAASCAGDVTVADLERLLDGLVRAAAWDPVALRRAVAPVVQSLGPALDGHQGIGACLHGPIGFMVRAAIGAPQAMPWRPALYRTRDKATGLPASLPVDSAVGTLQRWWIQRIVEVGIRFVDGPVPALLATPTDPSGAIDPAVLLDRIAAAERDGWEPPRYDLGQALLRLPRDVPAPVAGQASKLESPAGRALAAWIAGGGLPDPVATRLAVLGPLGRYDGPNWDYRRLPSRRMLVDLAPPPGYEDEHQVLTLAAPARLTGTGRPHGYPVLWTAVLPAHREVVAAHALGAVAAAADADERGAAPILTQLARAAGPLGPAAHLALAYASAARHGTDRTAAADAIRALDASGELDAATVGNEIGELAADHLIKLKVNRIAGTLGAVSAAGAPALAWRVVAAALPRLLTARDARAGLADLLDLAIRWYIAAGAPPTRPIPELARLSGGGRTAAAGRALAAAIGTR
ncbi:hypothetical protein GCM10022251_78810 [Phytohabitans flavus]|uniref:Uncharacterized protein n=1 Tax=Phytohabitans flavus TaxID=1076124 RepID=A0A6F8XLU2_9ACTN|nr:hypothetical protein [Phytohabitans flavus]BCB74751.1 hypothetical protein Pflav_011610 [Phytohabitans flavus]